MLFSRRIFCSTDVGSRRETLLQTVATCFRSQWQSCFPRTRRRLITWRAFSSTLSKSVLIHLQQHNTMETRLDSDEINLILYCKLVKINLEFFLYQMTRLSDPESKVILEILNLLCGCKYKIYNIVSYCKFCIYTHPVNSKFKIWQQYNIHVFFKLTWEMICRIKKYNFIM